MKRYLTLIVLLVLISYICFAELINCSIKFVGDSIYTELRTSIPIEVLTNGINFVKLQKKLICYDSDDNWIRLKASQIQELKFVYRGVRYIFEAIEFSTPPPFRSRKKLLLHKIVSGELNYNHYYEKSSVPTPIGVF